MKRKNNGFLKSFSKILGYNAKCAACILAAVLLAAAAGVYCIVAYSRTGTVMPTAELIDGRPTFRFIDVGQGDCTLVTYRGEAVLIDSGPASASSSAAEYIRAYAPNIDYFIITHPHEDHMGGCESVLRAADVDCLVLSTLTSGEEFYTGAIEAAEERGCEIMYLEDGCTLNTGNITVTVYDVFPYFSDDFNNSSLFVTIEADGTKLLVTGDAEEGEEEYAADKYGTLLDCDILKIGHHGSRTSTSEKFLDAALPETAVISCGKNNSYGHPSHEVVKRLGERGVEVRRTDKEGNVVLRGGSGK